MITVRFNPKALSREGQIKKEIPFVKGRRLSYYVKKADFPIIGVSVIRTGEKATLNSRIKDGDEIIIIPQIQGPLIAAVIAFAVIHPIIFASIAISILTTLYSVISSMTNRPQKPSFNTLGSGLTAGSPTYGWDGVQNTDQVAIPVGIVYGQFRIGGQIIGRYVNTDGNNNFLNVLIALGEGEIDSISNIEINQNPIANYSGISYDSRMGTNGQTPIPNFAQVHDTRSVAVTLASGSPHTYTTFATEMGAFELHFIFPNGLYQEDQNTGALNSYSVSLDIQYRPHGSGSYIDLGNFVVSDSNRSTVRAVFRKDGLAAGQYDIKVNKVTADSDFYHTSDVNWDTTDEITNDDLAYPNTALVSVTALATNQLSGAEPTITTLVKGKKVLQPQVKKAGVEVDWITYYYDPVAAAYKDINDGTTLTWDGTSYVTKWCANPVWCLYDILLNTRYGLGNFIDTTMVDLPSFIAMSQYCENKVSDGAGGYEKRMRLDIVLDAATKALDLLMQVAQSFRGLLLYSGGTIKVKIDKADTPVQLFGMGNIVAGSWQQNWISLKQRYNIIEVQFINQDIDYTQDMIAVIDEAALANGDPIRKKQIQVFTTKSSQAYREGRFILWMNKYIKRSVTLQAGIDAIICEAGDVINVAHDVPAWGIGSGRVQASSTSTVINLDQSVVLQSGITYAIMIQHNDGTIQEKTITTPPGTVNQVTVSSAFSFTPADEDTYSVGQISVEVKPFRIMTIKVGNDHIAQITAIEYNESIYDDTAPTLPTTNFSALSLDLADVTNLKLTSGVVKLNDGTIQSSIDVWFSKPDNTNVQVMYAKAKIYLSDNGGLSWKFEGETNDGHYQIVDNIIDGQSYVVSVVSVGADGRANLPADSPMQTIVSIGKSEPPSDVPSFLVNQSRDNIFFGWGEVNDVDLAGYEIRFGDSWDAGELLATQIKHSNYISNNISIGSGQKYFIKAIDTSGNYSTDATQAVLTIASIPFQNIISDYMEAAAWSGTKSSTVVVSSVLLVSTGLLSGTYTGPVRDIGFVATFKIGITAVVVDAGGDRRFNDDSTTEFSDDPDARFSGEEVSGDASFEINLSNDNITWGGWQPWQLGDYACRYFQIRMTLKRQNVGQNIQCSALNYYADLPDVDDYSGSLTVSNASTGLAVTYGKTFHQVPSVAITILSGSGVFAGFSSVPGTTGFTVKLYNAAGTAQTGTFSYHAHGV